ncbi:TolC family protein [Candidatus Deferrimicrobium sp.]|uniref:TolC family protein n=1 Tax=Candidatus Deferrimicrobium sp. TaxID=3060586 RepID=UPI002ED8BE0E
MKTSRLSLAVIAGAAVFLCVVAPHAGGADPDPKKSIPMESGSPATDGHALAASAGLSAGVREPTGELTLRQALALGLAGNPDLAAFSWEVRSGDPRILQAGLIPNPELGVELENFLGTETSRNFETVETTLSISQLVELGGKRDARIKLASSEKDVSIWEYEAKRADVAADVAKAFVEVLSAQDRLTLAEEFSRLAKEVLSAVAARVAAGKISPVEETKASVALSIGGIELERAKLALEGARKRLVSTWGNSKPVFSKAIGQLDRLTPVPPPEVLADRISRNPDVARWAAEMEQRKATLAQERANRIPDVTISGGVRRSREANDTSFVFGAAVPLPLFHRNQGKILESQYRVSKAENERAAAGTRVLAALSDAYQALAAGYAEATTLRSAVLPGAQSAFEATSEGFRQGKFGYLEVLDAQRTLFEARGRYVEALGAYHKAVADTERLIGGELAESVKSNETK